MNQVKPWDYNSDVSVCPDCEGTGEAPSWRQATVNDPYPTDPCKCGRGEHEPECPVCGYNLPVSGFDCLACATVGAMLPATLKQFDAEAFKWAVEVARDKSLAEWVQATGGKV